MTLNKIEATENHLFCQASFYPTPSYLKNLTHVILGEVLGTAEGMKENNTSWLSLFQWLRGRSLDGVKLVVSDKRLGMLEAMGEVFPVAK